MIKITTLSSLALIAFAPPSLASPSASQRSDLEAQSEEAFLDLDASLDPTTTSNDQSPQGGSDDKASAAEIDPQRNSIEETTLVTEGQGLHHGHDVEPTQQELYRRLLQEEADSRAYRQESSSESGEVFKDWEETPRLQPTVIVVEERPRRRWFQHRHYGLWHLMHHLGHHRQGAKGQTRNKHKRRVERSYRKKHHARAKRKAQRKVRRAKRNQRRSSRVGQTQGRRGR